MTQREKQLTSGPHGHQLTNINVWTPDSRWITYDVRPDGASFTGLTIERVNADNGWTEVIYQARDGAHVGVVTVSPQLPVRYVFIHGPEHPDGVWHYDFHHRRGVIVSEPDRGAAETLDAMDITEPYTPGALRGGSHVHVFSPEGDFISFTYNDHVMHALDAKYDQRNVGVAIPLRAVEVPARHPREYGGSHFCVLVTQTTPDPVPGSDDITRAYEEGWIGTQGYIRADGSRQRRALAFIGDTLSAEGQKVAEIFIADLPEREEDYDRAGAFPLQGTATRLPAPPAGVTQRRLTFTHQRRYPGLASSPRHWLRSSPDGAQIAFLMADDAGVIQLWCLSPNGGEPRQVTHGAHDVQSAFSWHPDGKRLAFVMDNSVMLCDVHDGRLTRMTSRTEQPPRAEAVVISPDGARVAYMRDVDGWTQIFTASLPA